MVRFHYKGSNHIDSYSATPDRDLTRLRKLPPHTLISFLISQGTSPAGNELDDFFDFDCNAPSLSALNQQRGKLKPDALEEVFRLFNHSMGILASPSKYRFLAANGSSFSFSSMVERQESPDGVSHVYLEDLEYCSYNNMAHVMEKRQFFLFRSKDVTVRGMAGHFPIPKEGDFDIWADVAIKRSHSKNVHAPGGYVTFVDARTSFDFVPYGSLDTCTIPVWVVRFPLTDNKELFKE